MKLSDFDYKFPKELIAKYPHPARDGSRLLIVDRKTNLIKESKFADFIGYLKEGDALVLNDTLVKKSRIYGKKPTGGTVEVLLLDKISEGVYNCLISPKRGIRPQLEITFSDNLKGAILDNKDEIKKISFIRRNGASFEEEIGKIALLPIPPYIKRPVELTDETRYQTVFAKNLGALAAPTAGLHFTESILKKIEALGVEIAYVTLDVSFGTFSPIKEDDFTKHKMHKEYFKFPKTSADIINKTKSSGGKVIAVGTTSLRVLETSAISEGIVKEAEGETGLFIYPPAEFKAVDTLLTNFHFPRSTLLLLVSAFAGYELIMKAYNYAIENKFRLFSYGDAMLIL